MAIHGGDAPFQSIRTAAANPGPSPTFRNFLRAPEPHERFELGERLAALATGANYAREVAATRELLGRLDQRMRRADAWTAPLRAGLEPWENPDIPAGYTYLAQIVAHDLVHTSMIFPSIGRAAENFRNNRTFSLDLDTLYGGGPGACPAAYAIAETRGAMRTRLRLSAVRPLESYRHEAKPPNRDIGRACPAFGNDGFDYAGPTEALLADARNDDNAVVSQLLTVFIHLHNAIIRRLETIHPRESEAPINQWLEGLFAMTRSLVCRAYRSIVRHDLAPRLLHPAVNRRYQDDAAPLLDCGGGAMPLEFSHAAFRFGHAMVRPSYVFQAGAEPFSVFSVLLTTSSRHPWDTPLNHRWIAQWSMFFDLGEPAPANLSRRIGPSTSGKLPSGFSENLGDEPKSLLHRDLLRGASIGLWKVEALIRELSQADRSPSLIESSPLLADFDRTRSQIEAWLVGQGLGADDSATIAADPPLFLFVLYEAMAEPGADGRRLGVLGSIIVAETLFGALRQRLPDAMAEAEAAELFHSVTGEREISSMPDLIRLVARLADLEDAIPPFL